jgi:hypothetical protein
MSTSIAIDSVSLQFAAARATAIIITILSACNAE